MQISSQLVQMRACGSSKAPQQQRLGELHQHLEARHLEAAQQESAAVARAAVAARVRRLPGFT
eukprot:8137573-Alexandrium_andersonii.AAC.1